MKNVDVIINVYGKPWQTICTLKTLMKYSGHHIDKIFLIKEKEQPYNENIDWVFSYFVSQPYSHMLPNMMSKWFLDHIRLGFSGLQSA